MKSKLMESHDRDVAALQEQVRQFKKQGKLEALSLGKESSQSNTTRSGGYKKNSLRLDVDKLNRALLVDPERKLALVEPRVSMQKLVQETMKYGLVPKVVPEFKGITVGGAIMGCGGESSSHKHGLFQDICLSYKLLLGDGTVIWASRSENQDLFYAVGGSYGSLALLLACEIALEPALPYVTCTFQHYDSPLEAIQSIRQHTSSKNAPEFIEGIIYSPTHALVVTGQKANHPVGPLFKDSLLHPRYYERAKDQTTNLSIPLVDYFFRHDRAAFWMGAYVCRFGFLRKLLLEGIWKLKAPTQFSPDERHAWEDVQNIPSWVRAICYPFMPSQRLFSLLHRCEDWVSERLIVQDFTLPEYNVEPFLTAVEESSAILPLWLCPVKESKQDQLFAPHSLGGHRSINVGVYGLPKTDESTSDIVRFLERELHKVQGRKWLYTHSYYQPDEFWQIYSHDTYRALRSKYHADGSWLSIENKVLSK